MKNARRKRSLTPVNAVISCELMPHLLATAYALAFLGMISKFKLCSHLDFLTQTELLVLKVIYWFSLFEYMVDFSLLPSPQSNLLKFLTLQTK